MIQNIVRRTIIREFIKGLKSLEHGTFTLITPRGVTRRFVGSHSDAPAATLQIASWEVIVNAAKRGDIGLGEDYIDGKWESPDISALIEVFCRNMACFEPFAHGNMFHRAAFRIINALRANRKSQSKRNISAHYDVGNEFYQLWLDDSMTYSSALYAGEITDLRHAQAAKYQRILDIISPDGKGKNVLEIGSGWGGFAEAAAHANHDVTALTISPAQFEFAEKRLSTKGLLQKVKLKLLDYRDSSGVFDAIASIEMFEAVGEKYWPTYFRTVKERLKRGGTAVIQTITIDDAFFDDYRTRSDFIRQYTFPGGMLPSVARFREEAAKAGLRCKEVYAFGLDYARTLQEWLERFDANREKILHMGYSESFIRSWRFYLGMCIGAFMAGRTNVVQVELEHA
jgi:cyclopropane-fatty-acyl-phospholipid synthase